MFQAEVRERLLQAPWIEGAGWSLMAPLTGRMTWTTDVETGSGQPPAAVDIDTNVISPGYFAALGIPLVAGRDLDTSDHASAPSVAVVSESLAARYFPAGPRLGRRLRLEPRRAPNDWTAIVGVVGDVRRGLNDAPVPMMYLPIAQQPAMLDFGSERLMVRSTLAPQEAVVQAAALVGAADPNVPVTGRTTMSDHLRGLLMPQRLGLTLFAAFGGLASVLTTLGVFAIVAYGVAHRTREIGLRMALGAESADLIRLVVRQGAKPVGLGLVAGLLGFTLASSAVRRFMFEASPNDPLALVLMAGVIGIMSVLAIVVPARRATRIAPTVALRHD
jgi:ABC-type antimicrobial peptide transport system permease subunit